MEQILTLGNLITLGAFLLAVASVIKVGASGRATMAEQIKTLFKQHEDMKKHDAIQDRAITQLADKTTKVATTVAVIEERTVHIQHSGERIEKALEKLVNSR